MDNYEKDISILKALYFGNHLEPNEIKIALKLLYSLNVELKSRVIKK